MKPLLSIIILSYNTKILTLQCLKSIEQDKGLELNPKLFLSTKPKIPTEIIVIDNNSSDDSVEFLKKNLKIKLITNQENLGFSKANNQGLKNAQGNYVLFLNSDTIILHSAISQSLDWLSSHPEASICTAQLLNSDKSIQPSGGFFPNLINVFTWSLFIDDLPFLNLIFKPLHPHAPNFYTKDNFYLNDHRQDWVTGAFMLVRKNILDQIGGFDENYFMYSEELEMTYRIRQNFPDFQVWYLIGPQIIHFGGASATTTARPIILEYQGILKFFKKHKSTIEYKVALLLIKINALLRGIIYLVLGNKPKSQNYLQACSQI